MVPIHPFLQLTLWSHQTASRASGEHRYNWKEDGEKRFDFSLLKCKEFWGNIDSSEIFAFLQAHHQPLYELQNRTHQNDSTLFAAAVWNWAVPGGVFFNIFAMQG